MGREESDVSSRFAALGEGRGVVSENRESTELQTRPQGGCAGWGRDGGSGTGVF